MVARWRRGEPGRAEMRPMTATLTDEMATGQPTLAEATASTADAGGGSGGSTPRADTGIRRAELAAFLRSRRERISPDQVGVAPGGRRRTPGLRREEVAQLAGVGVTWYTWLEQGRDIKVPDQ